MSDARATSAMDHVLGKKLRQAREGAGLSQQALAERLGITFQQIQKYERAANRIAVTRLISIARALDKPVSYFLEESKDGPALQTAAGGLGAIENAKVRGRMGDLLRAILDVELAQKSGKPGAPKPKPPVRKPGQKPSQKPGQKPAKKPSGRTSRR